MTPHGIFLTASVLLAWSALCFASDTVTNEDQQTESKTLVGAATAADQPTRPVTEQPEKEEVKDW